MNTSIEIKGFYFMKWKTLLLKFLRNLVISIVVFAAILSLIGYLLSGREGLLNLARFGLILGVLGGLLSSVGMILEANFWGKKGNYKFLPEWNWFIKKSDDENQKPDD
jgi:hypothetical protein